MVIELNKVFPMLKTTDKIKTKDKSSLHPLAKKSALTFIVLPVTIFLLTGLVVMSSSCSPISLSLKVGIFEYQLQKGSCDIPQLPSQ